MSSDFDPSSPVQPAMPKGKGRGKGKDQSKPPAEIPAPTEPIVKTAMWWSTDLAHLSAFEKCVLNNMEVLGAQMTQVMMQLEQNTATLNKIKNRRSSFSSVATSADTSAADTTLIADDDDDSHSQEQVRIQKDLQGPQFEGILRDRYNQFVTMNKKKIYKIRNGPAKNDAKEFKTHLLDILPDEDEGLGPNHPFTDLVGQASDGTFLNIYVELGKVHPSNNKPAKKPKTAKQVQTVGGSQARTVVENFDQSDEPLARATDSEEDEGEDDEDEDSDDDSQVTISITRGNLQRLAAGSSMRGTKGGKGARGTKSGKAAKSSTKSSTPATKNKKRTSLQRESPTTDEERAAACKRREGHDGRKKKINREIPETDVDQEEEEEEEGGQGEE